MSTSTILALPEELLIIICSFARPDYLVRLAQTCKTLRRVTRDLLREHRDYEEEYSYCHDRPAMAVPELLRLTVHNRSIAWHIHHLEFWTGRWSWSSWDDWPPGEITTKHGRFRALEPQSDHSDLTEETHYEAGELQHYARLLRHVLRLSSEDIELWMERTSKGWDEVLKGLLIALAPGLTSVKFARYARRKNSDEWEIAITSFPIVAYMAATPGEMT